MTLIWTGKPPFLRRMAAARTARLKVHQIYPYAAMSLLRSRVFRHYLSGLLCTFAGAWLTEVTGSLWPLAFGAAVLLMCTLPLVKAAWAHRPAGEKDE